VKRKILPQQTFFSHCYAIELNKKEKGLDEHQK
jgi:hypothetical protein